MSKLFAGTSFWSFLLRRSFGTCFYGYFDEKIRSMNERLTPTETIKAYCMGCLGLTQFNTETVRNCQGDQSINRPCPFFPYRLGKRIPVRVFRAFCLQCMGGSSNLVRECETVTCPVHPYRFGTNPSLKGRVRGASLISKCSKEGVGGQFSRQESTFRGTPMRRGVSK